MPTAVTLASEFVPASFQHTINDNWTVTSASFDATWTTVPLVCDLKYTISITPQPANPNLFAIDSFGNSLIVSV